MTEREKEIEHFAHEHPLVFNESEDIPFCCNACGLLVLSSPSYICTAQDCSFYLHEPCTRLPHKLSHRVSDELHDLRLLAKPHHEKCMCSKCGKLCKNFTYHCDECDEFDLDPLCGYPLDIQIKHVSHKEHPLVANCRESLLLCDVCGREHRGFFFQCHRCNFLIHHDCTSLPSFQKVGDHRHPISLMYSGALSATDYSSYRCIICQKDTSQLFGAYTCMFCEITAHVGCVISAMGNPGKIYDLPLDDGFLSWITSSVENTTPNSDGETKLEEYHSAHPLILNHETARPGSVCNACIRHIAPPYYSCSQSDCDFLLHKYCTDLPLFINDYFGKPRNLVFPRCNEFFSLSFCMMCLRFGNGFGYYDHYRSSVLHLECGWAPLLIKHDSHKQHPLIRGGTEWLEDIVSCCDKTNPYFYDIYGCTQCRFSIHVRCALLPKNVTHKFDKHPLTLIMDSSAKDLADDHFCEFCEEDIKPSHWFYRCMECDNSFHVECIPSTGKYSRIKFGGTVVLPDCHGDHPLSLVRMLSVGSQTCGVCREMIEGFKDGMALHCPECDFWIHFKCGSESSDATISEPPYRDLFYL